MGSPSTVAGVGMPADAKDAEQAPRFAEVLLGEAARTDVEEESEADAPMPGVPIAEGSPAPDEVGSTEIDPSDLATLRGTFAPPVEVGVIERGGW